MPLFLQNYTIYLLKIFKSPYREYLVICLIAILLGVDFFYPELRVLLMVVAVLGSLATFVDGVGVIFKKSINISTFNSIAIIISFVSGEIKSAAFIVLMLNFASLLEYRTSSKAKKAIEELLKLKPLKAALEKDGEMKEVNVSDVCVGDILFVKNGAQIPVDGIVIN